MDILFELFKNFSLFAIGGLIGFGVALLLQASGSDYDDNNYD